MSNQISLAPDRNVFQAAADEIESHMGFPVQSISQMNPPARAYRKGLAYVALSNPDAERVVIWSLLVEKEARGKRLGTDILKSVIAHHRGKTWHVPAIFPEEFESVFTEAGFEREELSQWQMRLSL